MHVTVHKEQVSALLDVLLERWEKKLSPYNKKDAIIPQTIIPKELRDDKKALAIFYFYVCIYMRGGIESIQAFQALLRMREDHPECFDPFKAQHLKPAAVQDILKTYIGWDSKAASKNWVENSWRLVWYWGGNVLELFKGVSTYEEALRRLRNKRTKRDLTAAGNDGKGFMGFQPKMVSMLTYFLDWEGLLKPRFPYPSPADFHNFRLGLALGALIVSPKQKQIRSTEKLSAPWRDAVMEYIVKRKADPVKVADALWLFSLVMCGNSPLTATQPTEDELKARNGSGMFEANDLPHQTGHAESYLLPRFRRALTLTCLRCPVRQDCSLAIPSGPYYRQGYLALNPRFRVEEHLLTLDPDTPVQVDRPAPENLHLFAPGTS